MDSHKNARQVRDETLKAKLEDSRVHCHALPSLNRNA